MGRGKRRGLPLLVTVVAWLLVGAISPGMTVAGAALVLLLISAAVAVHVVVHEAAHALAGVAVGLGVPEVQLGGGSSLLRLRVGSTVVKVGGFHAGATRLEPRSSRLVRTRLAVTSAAGPLSNLALAAAVHWLVDPPAGLAAAFARDLVGAGVILGVLNLAPLTVSVAGGRVSSDGAAVLALLRRGRDTGDQLVAAGRLHAAHRQHLAGETLATGPEAMPTGRADPVVWGMEGTRRILTGEYDEAVALLREALAMPQADDTRALTANNLAWALLLARPAGWLEEADHASADAISLEPGMAETMGTRGCVLVHRGEFDEARPLLQGAVQAEAARKDLLVLYRHLFRAEHGLGNLYGARAALLALLDHGAGPEEIASARALLQPWEVDNALANLVGGDGLIRWPDDRGTGAHARHIEEIRSALATFVEDARDDPRGQALRLALGQAGPAS